MDHMKEKGDDAFYDRLDSTYPSDEEDSEVHLSLSYLAFPYVYFKLGSKVPASFCVVCF